MTTVADMSHRFKVALVQAARDSIADPTVKVCFGHPGQDQPDDIVAVMRVSTSQEPGPISSVNRARDITLTADVMISVARGGGQEMEQVCAARAHELLTALEEHVRVVDTNLDGTVLWCFCSGTESDGSTDPQVLADGRLIEVTATFTARGRITSR